MPPGASAVVGMSCGGSGGWSAPRRALGVAAEAGDDLGHLQALGHPHGGAGLGLHERDQLVVTGGDDIGQGVEQVGPLGRVGLRPRPEGGRGGVDGGVGVVDRGVGGLAHHLLGGRVADLVTPVAPGDELATDEELLGTGVDDRDRGHGAGA